MKIDRHNILINMQNKILLEINNTE